MSEPVEVVVGQLLLKHKRTLALAESCTGGLIGQRITDVPGSSEYFVGGRGCAHTPASIAAGPGRMAGTTIETAICIMSRFRKEGWGHTEPGGYIAVTDFDRLQRFSEGV